jgi:membrane protein YdbS with pleckstrin-like domain
MKDFILMPNEKLIKDIKPLPGLKKFIFLKNSHWLIITIMLIVLPFFDPRVELSEKIILYLIATIPPIIIYFISIIVSKKFHYWITDRRVVVKYGVISYSITSIPLERISDILISKSFVEKLAGISSIEIKSLAGQRDVHKNILFYYRSSWYIYTGGGSGKLLAVPEPEQLQKLLLHLVSEKRKHENITF